jgi:hypothetical protein
MYLCGLITVSFLSSSIDLVAVIRVVIGGVYASDPNPISQRLELSYLNSYLVLKAQVCTMHYPRPSCLTFPALGILDAGGPAAWIRLQHPSR